MSMHIGYFHSHTSVRVSSLSWADDSSLVRSTQFHGDHSLCLSHLTNIRSYKSSQALTILWLFQIFSTRYRRSFSWGYHKLMVTFLFDHLHLISGTTNTNFLETVRRLKRKPGTKRVELEPHYWNSSNLAQGYFLGSHVIISYNPICMTILLASCICTAHGLTCCYLREN